MKTKIIVTLFILWLYNMVVLTQDYNEMIQIVASDSTFGDSFGWSIDLSGNYAIIGAFGESEDALGDNTMDYAGSAYLFERDIDGNWNEAQKIVASDRAVYDYFGTSISISGNYAIVGASQEDEDNLGVNTLNGAGSAYIFERDGFGNWNEVQKIVASDRAAEDYFAGTVSISGNYIIVGASYEDEDTLGDNTLERSGSAYIFERNENGNWNEVQKIIASDRAADDYFGYSVGISGIYAVVGAYREDEDTLGGNTMDASGSAYIFERNNNGNWKEVQKIVATDRAATDHFGTLVSISGDYIIVSSPREDEDASGENTLNEAGSAYLFERNFDGNWNEVQKIVASDRAAQDYFGGSLKISGNYAIVGVCDEDEDALGENTLDASGSAYIFERNGSGNWNQFQKIVASDRAQWENFGISASISGDYAIVGKCSTGGPSTGSAYIFESCNPGTGISPDNIIENGDFEACILSPWSVYNADYLDVTANAVLIDGTCTVSGITLSAGPEHWDVQLNQQFTATQLNMLEKDSAYVLTFDASAETDNRQCRIAFDQDEEPWIALLDENRLIGTGTESYSFEFIVDSTFSAMKLSFQLGLETSPVTFDNVKLIKKAGGSPSAVDQVKKNDIQLFPNPASEYLTVIAENGAIVKLYNNMGLLVKSDIPVSNRLSFDVSDLPAGIYIVEISNGRNVSAGKVIIY